MAHETGTRSARAVAADAQRAALDLIKERTALVGAASAAQHRRNELAAALQDADVAYVEAYQAAINGGWSAEDLHRLGLRAPNHTPARRHRPVRPAAAAPAIPTQRDGETQEALAAGSAPSEPVSPIPVSEPAR